MEEQLSLKYDGIVLNDNKSKIDMILSSGKNVQIKSGNRWQFALYSSKERINNIPHISNLIELLLDNMNVSVDFYRENRLSLIKREAFIIKQIYNELRDKNKLYDFLNYILSNNIDELYYYFCFGNRNDIDRLEIIEIYKNDFIYNLAFCNELNISAGDNRKILIKNNKRNLLEIEVRRKSKPSLLVVSTSKNIYKILPNMKTNIIKDKNEAF